ncbi:MAG TPA: hypothetical protein VNG53_06150 [Bacteroidia bacterium]|nr:hypothetical protein [Bacteroidia bacterium]
MCTNRKSKWLPLISIGLLIVVLPNIIEHLSSWHITRLYKETLMVSGVLMELIGVILINKEKKRQTKQQ